MTQSSRARARTWPYPRHRDFQTKLRTAASTWFREKGFATSPSYPYILANWDNWPQNVILPEVASYIQAVREQRKAQQQGFPLHKYIHHGLSSQALVFNLIGPLIVRNDLDLLREAFLRQGVIWPEGSIRASFEYENRAVFNEDTGQPTSIDLVISDNQDHPRLFIESKLIEQEFGGCSVFQAGDCDGRNPADNFSLCYLHHLGRQYWPLLEKYNFLSSTIGQNATCILSTYYQFFREVTFALELGGAFVVIYDERNPTFISNSSPVKRGLIPFLLSMVPPSLHSRIASVSIQQILATIKASGRHEWTSEFERKYALGGNGPN
jgi:POLQ-like helicase